MSRIRSVHPGLFTDEAFMVASAYARVLLIGLWTEADDQGVFEWKPLTIKARLLPVDAVEIVGLLEELQQSGSILRFEAEGKPYGAIKNFRKFQRPQKPNAIHPLPEPISVYVGLSATVLLVAGEQYETDPVIPPQMEDVGCRMNGNEEKKKGAAKPTPRDVLETVLDQKRAKALIDHRQRKKSPLGEHAAELLARKLSSFANPNAAADLMIEKGWASIEPDWAPGLARAPVPVSSEEARTTWITNEDPRWAGLAARYAVEHHRSLTPMSSKHAQGLGWHFPNEWLLESERAA